MGLVAHFEPYKEDGGIVFEPIVDAGDWDREEAIRLYRESLG
jgi:hypothetical protein